jgi:MFS family permease
MVPLSLFRNKVFSASSFSLVLVSFANGGLMLVLTQYLQYVLDYSPTDTGLAFAPMAVAALVFNAVGATLCAKVGNRIMSVIGLLIVAAGFGTLAALTTDSGFGLVALAMVLIGVGGGIAQPAIIGALMGAVPAEHAGVGSALNDTVQQTGAALGVAVLGAVLSSTFTDGMPAGTSDSVAEALKNPALVDTARDAFTTAMSASFIVGAIGVAVAAVIAGVLMRDQKSEVKQEELTLAG